MPALGPSKRSAADDPNRTGGPSGGLVVGLLLASGSGRRFDAGGRRNKLLARLPDGQTVVHASARAFCSALERVAVVVPARGTLLEAALSDLPVRLIRNARAKDGMGASIAVGVAALREQFPDATGWLIALGDMPFVLPQTLRAVADVLAADRDDAAPIVVAVDVVADGHGQREILAPSRAGYSAGDDRNALRSARAESTWSSSALYIRDLAANQSSGWSCVPENCRLMSRNWR